jgi:hypothetical protein
MKTTSLIFKYLFAVFLVICVGVHVYGLFAPITHEGTASHLVHIASYSLCLLTFLVPVPGRPFVYLLAAVYPFAFHAHCAWVSLHDNGSLNGICILVVCALPMGAAWLFRQK